MDLKTFVNKVKEQQAGGQKVLLYGHPKSGKTFLAGSLLKHNNYFKNIYWMDFEHGASTLLNPELGLTEQNMQNAHIYQVQDMPDTPYAIETALKLFQHNRPTNICVEHGRFDCPLCKNGGEFDTLPIFQPGDLVVVDSLSAISDSAATLAEKISDKNNKFAKFGAQGDLLKQVLQSMQYSPAHVCAITHVTVGEDEATGKDTVAPLCGTRNFSLRVGRYFDAVVYRAVELKKYVQGSTPLFKINVISGSRTGVALENNAEFISLFKGANTAATAAKN